MMAPPGSNTTPHASVNMLLTAMDNAPSANEDTISTGPHTGPSLDEMLARLEQERLDNAQIERNALTAPPSEYNGDIPMYDGDITLQAILTSFAVWPFTNATMLHHVDKPHTFTIGTQLITNLHTHLPHWVKNAFKLRRDNNWQEVVSNSR